MIEARRRRQAQQPIQIHELATIQAIELRDGVGGIVIAEPPEPVGALAQRELVLDGRATLRDRLSPRASRGRTRAWLSHSRSHAAFFAGSPIHVASVPCTQLPVTTFCSGRASRPSIDDFGQRHELDQRMIRERCIQRAQEVVAVERVILPRVLAIEGDQQRVPAFLAVVVASDLRQLLREVLRGVVAVPGRIVEADAIRQRVVAEDNIAACRPADVYGRLYARGSSGSFDAARREAGAEHVGARGDPLEARFFQQLEASRCSSRLRTASNRLGCVPNARRENTQAFLHMPLGALRATGIARVTRQRHSRHGFARGLEIEQQRNDRMPVGRDGQAPRARSRSGRR